MKELLVYLVAPLDTDQHTNNVTIQLILALSEFVVTKGTLFVIGRFKARLFDRMTMFMNFLLIPHVVSKKTNTKHTLTWLAVQLSDVI